MAEGKPILFKLPFSRFPSNGFFVKASPLPVMSALSFMFTVAVLSPGTISAKNSTPPSRLWRVDEPTLLLSNRVYRPNEPRSWRSATGYPPFAPGDSFLAMVDLRPISAPKTKCTDVPLFS